MEDAVIFIAGYHQRTSQAFFSSRQGVVYQSVITRNVELEFDNRSASRSNQGGLDVFQWRAGKRSLIVDAIKNLANDMEAGNQVRTAHAEEDSDGFAHLGLKLVAIGKSSHGAVEHQVFRLFVQQFFKREFLMAHGAVLLGCVQF